MSSPVALPPVAAQPPSLLTVIAAPAPADSPVVTLAGSPQALAALAALADPSSFTGTIAAGDSPGSLVLVTSFGTFALDNAPSLAIGAQLTLQTVASTPGGVAILAIDNVPTAAAAPIQPETGPPSPAALEETPPTIINLGTLVSATVIAAVATAAATEVAASQNPALDPTAGAEPAPGAAGAAEQIAPVLAASAADPTRDATASAPNLDSRSSAIAESQGIQRATIPGATSRLPAAAAILDNALSSARLDVRQILAGGPVTDNRSAAAGRALATSLPDEAPAPAASSLIPGMRGLPVGANLIIRILAFQTVAAAGAGDEYASPALAEATLPGSTSTGAALSGVVRTAGPAGAIVETAIGALRLSPVPPLPPGTPIALRLLPGEPATAILTVAPEAPPEADSGELPAATSLHESQLVSEQPAPQRGLFAIPPSAVAAVPGSVPSSSPAARSDPAEAFITRIFIAPSATSAAAAPHAVIGTIVGEAAATPGAASLVETSLGVLAVAPRLTLPPGTLLLLAAQDAPLPPDASFTGPTTSFENGWPALQAAIGTLSHTAPTLASHLLADLSAHDGETLAASLLFLVATLRTGGPAAWPGAAVERSLALAGRDDLKERLGEDVGELRRIAADPATGHWQVFMLPVHDGTALRPVRLYLARRDKRAVKDRHDEDNSRFVLEFELSRIGALQLDGFIRRRRFDLALRSRVPLAAALRADVARIFHARITAAGLTGEIEFATVVRFDIAPLDALHGHVGLAV